MELEVAETRRSYYEYRRLVTGVLAESCQYWRTSGIPQFGEPRLASD
jgi:hypothetical protein